jgi:hypothetical protein
MEHFNIRRDLFAGNSGSVSDTNVPVDPLRQMDEFYQAIKDRKSVSRTMYHKFHHVIPYVFMFADGGRVVLCNRRYQPLVELDDRSKWVNAPMEWIPNVRVQSWIYDDGTAPWIDNDTFRRVKTILKSVLDI